MEDLSLHILDIAENSIAAGARNVSIAIHEDIPRNLLSIEIADDGKGMSAEVAERAADPFYTTRTTRRIGLGLALLREAATAANGTMDIRSTPGSGTTIRATFRLGHIDRKPLGSMTETIIALLVTSADIDILYTHTRKGRTVVFDTKEIRHQLGDLSLNSTGAVSLIRDYLSQEEETLAH
jgi:anti-sigma regulatory factor (Ser/Thr protein kinase)